MGRFSQVIADTTTANVSNNTKPTQTGGRFSKVIQEADSLQTKNTQTESLGDSKTGSVQPLPKVIDLDQSSQDKVNDALVEVTKKAPAYSALSKFKEVLNKVTDTKVGKALIDTGVSTFAGPTIATAKKYLVKPKSEEQADIVKKFDSFQTLKQQATKDEQGNLILPKETGKEAAKRIFVEEKGASAIPFISGAVDIKEIVQVVNLYRKLEAGTADEYDVMRLSNFADENGRDKNRAAKVIETISGSLAFAGELYATAGVGAGAKTTAVKGTKEALEKVLSKEGTSLIKKKTAEMLLKKEIAPKLVGGIAQEAIRAPIAGALRTGASTINHMLPQVDWQSVSKTDAGTYQASILDDGDNAGLAVAKALGETYVETLSERAGDLFGLIGADGVIKNVAAKTAIGNAFIKANAKLGANEAVKTFNAILKKSGWNGVIGEMLEERVGDVGYGILSEVGLSDQGWKMPTKDDLITELIAFSIPGTVIGLTQAALGKFGKAGDVSKAMEELNKDIQTSILSGEEMQAKKELVEELDFTPDQARVLIQNNKDAIENLGVSLPTVQEKAIEDVQKIAQEASMVKEVRQLPQENTEQYNAILESIRDKFASDKSQTVDTMVTSFRDRGFDETQARTIVEKAYEELKQDKEDYQEAKQSQTFEEIAKNLEEKGLSNQAAQKTAKYVDIVVGRKGTEKSIETAVQFLANPENKNAREEFERISGYKIPEKKEFAVGFLRNYATLTPAREEALGRNILRMQRSEPGYRHFTNQPHDATSNDPTVIGIPSTFPQHYPDELRSMDLFKRTIPYIEAGIRPAEHKKRMRELYDIVMRDIDSETATIAEEIANREAQMTLDSRFVGDLDVFSIAMEKEKQNSLISEAEAEAIVRKYFNVDEVPVAFYNKLRTPAGQEAWGKYANGMISFVNNPKANTPEHEVVHAFLDLFIPTDMKKSYLKTAMRDIKTSNPKEFIEKGIDNILNLYRNSISREQAEMVYAEEVLAEQFINYVNGKETKSSLRRFFDSVITFLKRLANVTDAQRLYEDIIARKRYNKQVRDNQIQTLFEVNAQKYANTTKTLKYLKDTVKKEVVNRSVIEDAMKRQGVTQADKDILEEVLANYTDEKINLGDFIADAESMIMPLTVIQTNKFADYGVTGYNFTSTSYGSLTPEQKKQFKDNARTLLFESPFKHGSVGHFPEVYASYGKNLSVREANNEFYVVDNDKIPVGITAQNIEELPDFPIVSKFETKEEAEKFIEDRQNEELEPKRSGMAFHVRYTVVDGEYYVLEIQSDSMQQGSYNYNKALDKELEKIERTVINEEIPRFYPSKINEQEQRILNNFIDATTHLKENGFLQEVKMGSAISEFGSDKYNQYTADLVNRYNEFAGAPVIESISYGNYEMTVKFTDKISQKIADRLETAKEEYLQSIDGIEFKKQFDVVGKNFHERAIKEFTRYVAMQAQAQGVPDVSINYPTPLTVSVVESHATLEYDKENQRLKNPRKKTLYDFKKNIQYETNYAELNGELSEISGSIDNLTDTQEIRELRIKNRQLENYKSSIEDTSTVSINTVSTLKRVYGVVNENIDKLIADKIAIKLIESNTYRLVKGEVSGIVEFNDSSYSYKPVTNDYLKEEFFDVYYPGYTLLEEYDAIEDITTPYITDKEELEVGDTITYSNEEYIVVKASSSGIKAAKKDDVTEYDQDAEIKSEVEFIFKEIESTISSINTIKEAQDIQGTVGDRYTEEIIEKYIEENAERSIQDIYEEQKDQIAEEIAYNFDPYIDGEFFSTDYYDNTGYIVYGNIEEFEQPYKYEKPIYMGEDYLKDDDIIRLTGRDPNNYAGPEDIINEIDSAISNVAQGEILPAVNIKNTETKEKLDKLYNDALASNPELQEKYDSIKQKIAELETEIDAKAEIAYAKYKENLNTETENKRGEYNFMYEENLKGNSLAVHKFYEQKVMPFLKKYKTAELRTTANGLQWWKIDVNEKDAGQIEVYQTKEFKKPLNPTNPAHLPYKEAEILYFENQYNKVLDNIKRAKEYIEKYKVLSEQVKDIPRLYRNRTQEQKNIQYEYEKYKKVQDWAENYVKFYSNEEFLDKYRNPSEADKNKFKVSWLKEVKEAISKGYDISQEVINDNPELKTAANNRERYEKGLKTSFANVSSAIDYSTQDAYGFKVKRQDGTPITKEQINEIQYSMQEMENALGKMTDIIRAKDITVAHTNGKYPFLSDKGGLFHRNEYTITVGIKDVKAFSHEMAHAIDAVSNNIDFSDQNANKYYDSKGYNVDITEEQVKAFDEITKARGYTYSRLTDLEKIKENNFVVNFADYARQIMNQVPSLKTSTSNTKEKNKAIKEMQVRISSYYDSAVEIFARFTEQYVAEKSDSPFNFGVEDVAFYEKTMSYWGKKEFELLKPLFEQLFNKKLARARTYTKTNPEGIKMVDVYAPAEDKELKETLFESTEYAGIEKPKQASLFDRLYQVKETDPLDDMFSKIYEIIEVKTLPINVQNDPISKEIDETINEPVPVQNIVSRPRMKESTGYTKVMETLEEELQGTLLYDTINLADQAAKAQLFVKNDRERAIRVAKELEQGPEDIILPAIRIALYESSLKSKNYAEFTDQLTNYSLGQTKYGQYVVASKIAKVNQDDTTYFAKLVLERRKALVESKYRPIIGKKKSVNTIIQEEKTRAKRQKGSPLSAEAIEDVQSFIDKLLCK